MANWETLDRRTGLVWTALQLAVVELVVVPLVLGMGGAVAFALLNAVLWLACAGGPKGWLSRVRGERDPLLPIERLWVVGPPISLAVAAVLGVTVLVIALF